VKKIARFFQFLFDKTVKVLFFMPSGRFLAAGMTFVLVTQRGTGSWPFFHSSYVEDSGK
jgi:hypothetical protein